MKNSPQLVVVQVAKYFNLKFMKQTGISDSIQTHKQHKKNTYSKQQLDMHVWAHFAAFIQK